MSRWLSWSLMKLQPTGTKFPDITLFKIFTYKMRTILFVMGFISNSENCWHFHTPSLISIYFEYLFLMFYWWISEYLTIFPALAIHTAYSDLSTEVEPVISNSPTDSMAHTKRILVPIDEKEHCMRAFDCKYITAVEYFTAAFGRPLVYCTSFQN